MIKKLIIFLYLFTFTLNANHLNEKDKIWKPIGPGFSNVISHAIVKSNSIYLLIDIGGLIKYNIDSKNWDYLSHYNKNGITSRSFYDFDISPQNEDFIIIAGDGIFISKDAGENWEKSLKGLPNSIYGKKINSYGQVKFNSDGSRIFTAIGIINFVSNAHIEKKLSENFTKKFIFLSKSENPESFSKIFIDDSDFSVIKKIYSHPTNPNIIYLSFDDGSFYLTLNAKDEPNKIKFQKINLPERNFVSNMVISKKNPSKMYLVLTSLEKNVDDKLMYSDNIKDIDIELINIPINVPINTSISYLKYTMLNKKLMSIDFQTDDEDKLIIGLWENPNLLRLDLNTKEIKLLELPKEEYENLDKFYGSIERVYRGNNNSNLIVSKTGAWTTNNNFETYKSLMMTNENGYYGNSGVSAIANVNTLNITSKYIYAGTFDHSAWRINIDDNKAIFLRNNVPLSLRIERLSWLGTNTYASYDNNFVILEDDARSNKYPSHHMNQDKKFLMSKDLGENWVDITNRLNKGDIFTGGSTLNKILFDKNNSLRQWWVFNNEVYFTNDGTQSFKLIKKLDNKSSMKIFFSDIIYDNDKKLLYLSLSMYDREVNNKVTYPKDLASILVSNDDGSTWNNFDIEAINVRAMSVLENSSLVIGTMKAKEQSAKLIIIPFNKKYTSSDIKIELANNEDEINSNQTSFWPIITEKQNILVYSNINWVWNDSFYAKGPLLSIDNGKSFNKISFDLPNTNIYSATMKDGIIVLGTTLGIMRAEVKDIIKKLEERKRVENE
jgi:hypothetical protein